MNVIGFCVKMKNLDNALYFKLVCVRVVVMIMCLIYSYVIAANT